MKPIAPPVDLPAEQWRIRLRGLLSFLVCAAVLGAAVSWLPERFDFPDEMGARLAFVLKANILILIWLLIAVGIVSTMRRYSASDIWGSAFAPPSERLSIPVAFLQNTLEQAVITIVSFLALATVAGDAPLAFVVGSVPLFALGRITFLRGYPRGAGARAFGMATTALPAIGAFVWVIFDMLQAIFRTAA